MFRLADSILASYTQHVYLHLAEWLGIIQMLSEFQPPTRRKKVHRIVGALLQTVMGNNDTGVDSATPKIKELHLKFSLHLLLNDLQLHTHSSACLN